MGSWTTSLFTHNVNNLLHSPDFWRRKIFVIVRKSMCMHLQVRQLPSVLYGSMFACSVICVFL